MTRREQADDLLLRAIDNMERDPNGQVALLRSLVLATIANAMLSQEALDATIIIRPESDDDDTTLPPEENRPPW